MSANDPWFRTDLPKSGAGCPHCGTWIPCDEPYAADMTSIEAEAWRAHSPTECIANGRP